MGSELYHKIIFLYHSPISFSIIVVNDAKDDINNKTRNVVLFEKMLMLNFLLVLSQQQTINSILVTMIEENRFVHVMLKYWYHR